VTHITFLSRGHGFGHAARDFKIIHGLRTLLPDMELTLASSAAGLDYYQSRDIPCHDLGILDKEDETKKAARQVWSFLQNVGEPDLLIADEVVWALPFSRKFFDCPRILLTDWLFADHGKPEQDPFLDAASEIMVLDFPEAHPWPYATDAPIRFTGPIVEPFPGDREAARERLGLPGDARIAVLSVGGRTGWADVRLLLEHITGAWLANASERDLLVVLDDSGYGESDAEGTILRVPATNTPDQYYRAADLVITMATGFTICEVVANAIPAIALLPPALWSYTDPFRRRIALLESAGLVTVFGIDLGPDMFWTAVETVGSVPAAAREKAAADLTWTSGVDVAAHLLSLVR
jgi:hypothetical protein